MTHYLTANTQSPVQFERKSNTCYLLNGRISDVNQSNTIYLANRLIYFPILIEQRIITNELSIFVHSGSSGALMNWAIYTNSNGSPANAIFQSGSVDVSTSGRKAFSVNLNISPGLYWAGYIGNNGAERYAQSQTDYSGFIGVPNTGIDANNVDVYAGTQGYQLLPSTAIPITSASGRSNLAIWYRTL